MLRALAEAENTRRRAERQGAGSARLRHRPLRRRSAAGRRYAGPRAGGGSRGWRDGGDEACATLLTGVELTERVLLDAFARHGLKRVGAKGEAFDPNLHQAVAQIPSPEPAGVIAEVMQPGYVLGDRTVRAAMVAVSAGPGGGAASVDIKV